MKRLVLPFREAKSLIMEGDVLRKVMYCSIEERNGIVFPLKEQPVLHTHM
jgi:hypothetical protein